MLNVPYACCCNNSMIYILLSNVHNSQDAEPEKMQLNAPAIRKKFFPKFDKYNILAL